jgi:hypothetical protein
MKVKELNLKECLTTTEYNPSPDRFSEEETPVSERTLPIIYTCDNCRNSVTFRTEDFQKHLQSDFSNLNPEDNKSIHDFLINQNKKLEVNSFLDFYCYGCKQATTVVFEGWPSGYWGFFRLEIKSVLVIKK